MSKSRNQYVVNRLLSMDDSFELYKPTRKDKRNENKRQRAEIRDAMKEFANRY